MESKLYKFCISTIVERGKLEGFASKGSGEVREGSAWKTGQALFLMAHKIEAEMPVIFSDAAFNTEKLLFWAILRRVESDGKGTKFGFDNIKKIRGNHRRQELLLRSTGKPIAANYIRPYAICVTPEFLE